MNPLKKLLKVLWDNKWWWIVPIVLSSVLILVLVFFGSEIMPFVYTMF